MWIDAFLNNNVAVAHCVNNSERSTQGAEATLLLRSGLLRFTRNDEKSESRNDNDRGNKRG